jgi:hypothetical protein
MGCCSATDGLQQIVPGISSLWWSLAVEIRRYSLNALFAS